MKGKRLLLFGLVPGIVIGWALGFLRLPYVEKNFSFLLGFTAALAFVSLLLILFKGFLPGLTGGAANSRARNVTWAILTVVLALGGILSGLAIYRQNEAVKLQIENQEKKLREMSVLVESVKKNDLQPLIQGLLEDIGEEIKHTPGRTLRDTTIARIAALSSACKPYRHIEADSLSEGAYSPGRGQLLQAFVLMNIDPGAFARIKLKVPFAGADLRGVDLKGLDLSGINLGGANLREADLSRANLTGANLGSACLRGANLTQAELDSADLRKADLSWAQLNEATLKRANLSGANLTNAQLIKADLYDATVQWTQSAGAMFNGSNLTSVDFEGSDLTKANLNQANLNVTNLRKAILSEADLVDVKLDNAVVDKDWVEKLKKWQPTGEKYLLEHYTLANDTFDKFQKALYRLKKN